MNFLETENVVKQYAGHQQCKYCYIQYTVKFSFHVTFSSLKMLSLPIYIL